MNTDETMKNNNEENELTEEELQEFMAAYKKELAHIYRMCSAKKSSMIRHHLPNLKSALAECDKEMRADIDDLKRKYGIHY